MGIGASVFLLAVGAIIAFALDVQVGWLDLQIVGWVLMLCGLVGLIFSMAILSRRRRTVVSSTPTAPVVTTPRRQVIDETAPEYDVDVRP